MRCLSSWTPGGKPITVTTQPIGRGLDSSKAIAERIKDSEHENGLSRPETRSRHHIDRENPRGRDPVSLMPVFVRDLMVDRRNHSPRKPTTLCLNLKYRICCPPTASLKCRLSELFVWSGL